MSEVKIVRNLFGNYDLYEGDVKIGEVKSSAIEERKIRTFKKSRFPITKYVVTVNNKEYVIPAEAIKDYKKELTKRRVKYKTRKITM